MIGWQNMSDWQARIVGLPATLSQFAHAYVLESADEAMRLQCARELAKLLLCQRPSDKAMQSCGQCQSCQLFSAKTHPDMLELGYEATIGIDEVRQVSRFFEQTSQLRKAQLVILDKVELMSESAANALLKTLEEPTSGSYLLLLTRSRHSLMATIRSRCQFLTVKNKSRNELKLSHGALPDYILGFAQNSESSLLRWQEASRLSHFETGYTLFIGWLRQKVSSAELAVFALESDESMAFTLYLIERRVRQGLLKDDERAKAAHIQLQRFNLSLDKVKGQNKTLAIAALLNALLPQVT